MPALVIIEFRYMYTDSSHLFQFEYMNSSGLSAASSLPIRESIFANLIYVLTSARYNSKSHVKPHRSLSVTNHDKAWSCLILLSPNCCPPREVGRFERFSSKDLTSLYSQSTRSDRVAYPCSLNVTHCSFLNPWKSRNNLYKRRCSPCKPNEFASVSQISNCGLIGGAGGICADTAGGCCTFIFLLYGH